MNDVTPERNENDVYETSQWETRVQRAAKALSYPPTPDLAARLFRRRRSHVVRRAAQAMAILLVALVGLLAVPEIRAQVIALFRIGAVEVVMTTATPAVFPSGELPASVLDFPGETTIDAARARVDYPIPQLAALGAPDHIYLIDMLRPIVVLAWLDADGAVGDSLHLLPVGTYSLKMYDGPYEEARVAGSRALWLPVAHTILLQNRRDQVQFRHVEMPALVWSAADGQVTYRFETRRSLDEALAIAEAVASGNGGAPDGVFLVNQW